MQDHTLSRNQNKRPVEDFTIVLRDGLSLPNSFRRRGKIDGQVGFLGRKISWRQRRYEMARQLIKTFPHNDLLHVGFSAGYSVENQLHDVR